MIQSRQIDESLLNMIKGSSAYHGLGDTKVKLALVQAASLMALEETTRATASQIAERAIREYGVEATASFTGQVFSSLGIGTAMTHGKSRFILEHDGLEEIRKAIEARCEEIAAKLETSIKAFQELPQKIRSLEKEWRNMLRLRQKESQLNRFINEEKNKPSRLPDLINEAKQLREQAAEAEELQKECRNLARKIKSASSLEERKKSLEAAIAKHQEQEKQIAAAERELASMEQELSDKISRLQKRMGWIELSTLEQSIEEAKLELAQLSRQLGEKRSLLDRLLHRKESSGGRS